MSDFSFPVEAVGAFADLGGEVITFEWEPPPEVVEAQLLRIAGYLDDIYKPLLAAKAIAKTDIQTRFDTETDPDGNEWVALDPEYASKKDAMGFGGNPILTLFGPLRAAASSEAAWEIHGNELFFNAGALPDYGLWHQTGTGAGGLAEELRSNIRTSRELGLDAGSTHENLGIGRGKALPARPFIGLSAEAEEQIFEVFDLWFAEGTSISISGSGTVQERIAGRFGSKIYPRAF